MRRRSMDLSLVCDNGVTENHCLMMKRAVICGDIHGQYVGDLNLLQLSPLTVTTVRLGEVGRSWGESCRHAISFSQGDDLKNQYVPAPAAFKRGLSR